MASELYSVNIWLDLCGLLIILAILFMHYLKHTLPLLQNTVYIMILISSGIVCLTNIISVTNPDNIFLAVWMNDLTVFFGVAVGALWVVYMSFTVNVNLFSKSTWWTLFIPLWLVGVGILLNHFIPLFFKLGPDGGIEHGPLYGMLMVVYGIYFISGIAIVLKTRKYISRERLRLLIPFVIIGIVGGTADIIYPEWRTIRFTLALCIVLYYFGLQNPDEYYDEESPLFNAYAFEQLFRARFDGERSIRCVAIYIRNTDFLKNLFSDDELYDIQKKGQNCLRRRTRHCMVFRIMRGRYLVVITRNQKAYAQKVYEAIKVTMEEMGQILSDTTPYQLSLLPFESPEDVVSTVGIENLIRHFCTVADRTKQTELTMEDIGIQSEREEKALENDIREALTEKRLEVFYQPIFEPQKNCFTSAEALIRMRDRDGNFVSPAVFIPAAERNGLVIDISDYVLDEVANTMSRNRLWEKGMEYIEVNLSVTECLQKDLVPRVMHTLDKYKLDPRHINLEITETASDAFSRTLDENIQSLHEKGLEFSLDDFGTGYSSLNRILELPLNLIKLDITLVRPAFEPGNNKAFALLECAVDIAKSVGTSIVAEGVETKEVADGIIALGVDHIQGYYYSKPLPKKEFLALVASQQSGN